MHEDRLKQVLEQVASGKLSIEAALKDLKHMPFEDLGFAKIDHHRQLRQGMAEVIFSPGKTPRQIVEIASRLKSHNAVVLATRISCEDAQKVCQLDPNTKHLEDGQCLLWGELPQANPSYGKVAIVTAGTADHKIANEAEIILQANAIDCFSVHDIGVAGIHRLSAQLPRLQSASVCIVIAGMDGVLPSVAGGLLSCPVIACPSSAGYGASFNGLAALLTMLNSCAAGLTVVNIDNGFGAAVAAIRILKMVHRSTEKE